MMDGSVSNSKMMDGSVSNSNLELSQDTAEEMRQVRRVEVDESGRTKPQWEEWPAVESRAQALNETKHISSGVFGVAKRRSSGFGQIGLGVGNATALTTEADQMAPGQGYGQDRVGVEEIWNESGKVVGKLLWVNDGHGNMGEKSAAEVANHLVMQYSLPGQVEKIQQALRNKDSGLVQQLVEGMYKRTAVHIAKKLGSGHEGGTTCSHALLIEGSSGQHFVITSNMGDSPVVIVDPKTGQVVETHGEHNWDNLDEYRLYDNHCQAKGVPTSAAVYNRFNCGNGQLPGPRGDLKPISIFQRNEQTSLMEVDPVNLQYITGVMAGWGSIGGFQSEARMVMTDKSTGAIKEPAPGYGHTNWGSVVLLEEKNKWGATTLEGGAQCTRSFADWPEQRVANTIGDTPTVNVTAVSRDAVVLVMSDGAADVIGYMHQFGQKVQEVCEEEQQKQERDGLTQADFVGADASVIVQRLGEWILDRGTTTKNYSLREGKPTWDDVTLAGATLIAQTTALPSEPVEEPAPDTTTADDDMQDLGQVSDNGSTNSILQLRNSKLAWGEDSNRLQEPVSVSPALGCRFLAHSGSSGSIISEVLRQSHLRVSF